MPFDRDAAARNTKAELLDELVVVHSELDALPEDPFDRAALERRTKAEILDTLEAELKGNDHQHAERLRAQADSIHNLMSGRSYDEEMAALHARAANLERQLEEARSELRRLKGETDAAYNFTTLEGTT